MQRWSHECGSRLLPHAPGSECASLNAAPRRRSETTSLNDEPTRRSVREKTWDEYMPRTRDDCFQEQRINATSSHETTYIKQDAVRFLAEKKFTETLLQEAELAETTLRHEEAMFQRCMDEIARDMRKIMEDERWAFVSEYLLHKSEQKRLKEDLLGLERVPAPPPLPLPRRCETCGGGGEEYQEYRARRSSSRPTTNARKCDECSERNEKSRLASPRSTQSYYLQQVNDRCLVEMGPRESIHARGDGKEKYECCVCEMNRDRGEDTHWPRQDGDYGTGFNAYEDADQDDYFRCPRHSSFASSPPGRARERRRVCYGCRAEAKRTHSEKLPLENTRGLAAVGACCRSEAAMLSPRRSIRCCARTAARQPRCPTCHTALRLRRAPEGCEGCAGGDVQCSEWQSPSATEQNVWSRNVVDRGQIVSRFSDKCMNTERPDVTRDTVTVEEEKSKYEDRLVNSEPQCFISRSRSRFDADEERVLLALIEQRDALLQEAVERGLGDTMAAIVALNKRIRAFLFSKPPSDDAAPRCVDDATASKSDTDAPRLT